MKFKYLLMSALMVTSCAVFTACGDDDEDDKENVNAPEKPKTSDIDAEANIDDSYSPTESEIQKVWAGEYTGWDNNQTKNTKIRRLLTLQAGRSYTNIIQGVLVESGKSEYVDFEHERGTYTYNARTKTITYVVASDSVLDYGKQQFDGYKGKKYYDHTDGTYTENVSFSKEKDGQRSWITHDMYLQSLTDKTINIAFAMIPNMVQEERK